MSSHIVNSSQYEVEKWVNFCSDFTANVGKQHALLYNLNQDLSQKSVLLGDGFKLSTADNNVFATVHPFLIRVSDSELQKYPHVLRWMDYIQNTVGSGTTLQKINVVKSVFDPPSDPEPAPTKIVKYYTAGPRPALGFSAPSLKEFMKTPATLDSVPLRALMKNPAISSASKGETKRKSSGTALLPKKPRTKKTRLSPKPQVEIPRLDITPSTVDFTLESLQNEEIYSLEVQEIQEAEGSKVQETNETIGEILNQIGEEFSSEHTPSPPLQLGPSTVQGVILSENQLIQQHPKKADKGDAESSSKKAISGQKTADKSNGSADSKKPAGETKPPENKENPTAAGSNKTSGEKKKEKEKSAGKTAEKTPEKAGKTAEKVADKESECNISILNIQVGLIRKAWKHPSADSLLVEEIDLGDGNVRQVVSGLAKYCSPDDLTNRHVVLITNVKPGKLRDVMSAGLVLCASTEDHTAVEPLIPPEGAKIGERISFAGFDGKPEDVLNPKKKQLDKITPHLHTDENGIATFKGVPFTTSAGPCRSSIRNGNVK